MDNRITFGDLKKVVDTIQMEWGASDDVIVIYDEHVAAILQELLDDLTQGQQ